jgi:hypothetical protein
MPILEPLKKFWYQSPGNRSVQSTGRNQIESRHHHAQRAKDRQHDIHSFEPRISDKYDPNDNRNPNNCLRYHLAPCDYTMIET